MKQPSEKSTALLASFAAILSLLPQAIAQTDAGACGFKLTKAGAWCATSSGTYDIQSTEECSEWCKSNQRPEVQSFCFDYRADATHCECSQGPDLVQPSEGYNAYLYSCSSEVPVSEDPTPEDSTPVHSRPERGGCTYDLAQANAWCSSATTAMYGQASVEKCAAWCLERPSHEPVFCFDFKPENGHCECSEGPADTQPKVGFFAYTYTCAVDPKEDPVKAPGGCSYTVAKEASWCASPETSTYMMKTVDSCAAWCAERSPEVDTFCFDYNPDTTHCECAGQEDNVAFQPDYTAYTYFCDNRPRSPPLAPSPPPTAPLVPYARMRIYSSSKTFIQAEVCLTLIISSIPFFAGRAIRFDCDVYSDPDSPMLNFVEYEIKFYAGAQARAFGASLDSYFWTQIWNSIQPGCGAYTFYDSEPDASEPDASFSICSTYGQFYDCRMILPGYVCAPPPSPPPSPPSPPPPGPPPPSPPPPSPPSPPPACVSTVIIVKQGGGFNINYCNQLTGIVDLLYMDGVSAVQPWQCSGTTPNVVQVAATLASVDDAMAFIEAAKDESSARRIANSNLFPLSCGDSIHLDATMCAGPLARMTWDSTNLPALKCPPT